MKNNKLLIFVCVFIFAIIGIAANKVYVAVETSISWRTTGGDELLQLAGLVQDGVAAGSYADLGSGSRSELYRWDLFIDGYDSAPVAGDPVELYWAMSTSTTSFTGMFDTEPTDAGTGTISEAALINFDIPGMTFATSTTAAADFKAGGIVRLVHRYVVPIIHNNASGADALLTSGEAHELVLTPIPPEVQ